MALAEDFKPFFANQLDPGPLPIEFVTYPNDEVAAWIPAPNRASIQNALSADGTHVTQHIGGERGWPDDMAELEPFLKFVPAADRYALTNINSIISKIDFDGTGWHIIAWDIVATDLNGNDIDKVEVDRRIADENEFFICDKITWSNGPQEGVSKHGYRHYK